MIRQQAIVEWRREAPWSANAMVEQDLVISRALAEMYAVPGGPWRRVEHGFLTP